MQGLGDLALSPVALAALSPATLHLPGHPSWTEEGFWLLSKPQWP